VAKPGKQEGVVCGMPPALHKHKPLAMTLVNPAAASP
jgi:hypothetical protein